MHTGRLSTWTPTWLIMTTKEVEGFSSFLNDGKQSGKDRRSMLQIHLKRVRSTVEVLYPCLFLGPQDQFH